MIILKTIICEVFFFVFFLFPSSKNVEAYVRRNGDNGGLKVLIVSTDNRPMHHRLEDHDYVGMSGVLMRHYAAKNGYDFFKVSYNCTKLQEKVRLKYPEIVEGSIGNDKYGNSVFHPGLKQYRSSSWSKLPLLWYVTEEYGQYYDYIWYFDSDATINPNYRNKSLSDALKLWNESNSMTYWGNKNVYKSQILFFSNFPWRDDLPCAGVILFKVSNNTEKILREWWDYDIPMRNHDDFMEQDVLWLMIEPTTKIRIDNNNNMNNHNDYDFLINNNSISLLNERQFPSAYDGFNSLWLIHVPNYWPHRIKYFSYMLHMINMLDDKIYYNAVKHINEFSHLLIDILDVTEAMESLVSNQIISNNNNDSKDINNNINSNNNNNDNNKGNNYNNNNNHSNSNNNIDNDNNIDMYYGNDNNKNNNNNININSNSNSMILSKIRRNKYPPQPSRSGSREDDNWHSVQTKNRIPPPQVGIVLEGLVIYFKSEENYWLIDNATRRKIENNTILHKLKYRLDMVVHFNVQSKEYLIPMGEPIYV